MYRKLALYALLSVIVLVFVGAFVRVTGAGMGCPDWPKCWGKYIPPTEKEQIDVTQLNQERFKKKWEKYRSGEPFPGDAIVDEFNATHAWTEYINRLTSLPVGIFTLLTMVFSFQYRNKKPTLFWGSLLALILVGVNAWMGARIVYTGLKPGTITIHMALAMLLLCVQVYLIVYSGLEDKYKAIKFQNNKAKLVVSLAICSFLLIVIEGVLGSQIREQTDVLQKLNPDSLRTEWVGELEKSASYIVHRSFSWLIVLSTIYWFFSSKSYRDNGVSWLEYVVLGGVLAQMVLGLTLAHWGVFPAVQILHVGISAIIICTLLAWIFLATLRPTHHV